MKRLLSRWLSNLYSGSRAQQQAQSDLTSKLSVASICGAGYILIFLENKTLDEYLSATWLLIQGLLLLVYAVGILSDTDSKSDCEGGAK